MLEFAKYRTRQAGAALLLLASLLFLVANRGAYQGFFQDDELDNLSWTRHLPARDFAVALASPRFLGNNFRPIGHLYYAWMERGFGLDYPKYIAVLHAAHLLNVWLVWLLARRLGIGVAAASLGTLVFAFHMALFDAYWKPMYIFDVLCALFTLTSLLLYSHKRFILSLAAFWLAYKSKELAVMLPAVLALYEWWFGERRWRRLAPFVLVALSFGLQALLLNPNLDNAYTLRFTPGAVGKSIAFYSSRIFLVPFAGLALVALPFVFRDRRVWFGLAAMSLFFAPLLVLPGRLFSAYCYLPLTGLALAVAAIASLGYALPVALCFLLWIPWNLYHLRKNRRYALTVAADNRRYVESVGEFARSSPDTRVFIHDGAPVEMRPWGIAGTLRYFYKRQDLLLRAMDEPGARSALRTARVALLNWDRTERRLFIISRSDAPDASYLAMDARTPLWQLDDGWYQLENRFRWIQPRATARLRHPAGAREFELTVNIGPDFIREIGRTDVSVILDGSLTGRRQFTQPGWQTVRWPVEPAKVDSMCAVEFRVEPPYSPANGDPRKLGVPIVGFGFRP